MITRNRSFPTDAVHQFFRSAAFSLALSSVLVCTVSHQISNWFGTQPETAVFQSFANLDWKKFSVGVETSPEVIRVLEESRLERERIAAAEVLPEIEIKKEKVKTVRRVTKKAVETVTLTQSANISVTAVPFAQTSESAELEQLENVVTSDSLTVYHQLRSRLTQAISASEQVASQSDLIVGQFDPVPDFAMETSIEAARTWENVARRDVSSSDQDSNQPSTSSVDELMGSGGGSPSLDPQENPHKVEVSIQPLDSHKDQVEELKKNHERETQLAQVAQAIQVKREARRLEATQSKSEPIIAVHEEPQTAEVAPETFASEPVVAASSTVERVPTIQELEAGVSKLHGYVTTQNQVAPTISTTVDSQAEQLALTTQGSPIGNAEVRILGPIVLNPAQTSSSIALQSASASRVIPGPVAAAENRRPQTSSTTGAPSESLLTQASQKDSASLLVAKTSTNASATCDSAPYGREVFQKEILNRESLLICERMVSAEGSAVDHRRGWWEVRSTDDAHYWPTLIWQRQGEYHHDLKRAPLIHLNSLNVLSKLAQTEIRNDLGILIVETPDGYDFEFSGRSEPALYLNSTLNLVSPRDSSRKYAVYLNVHTGPALLSIKDTDGRSLGGLLPLIRPQFMTYLKVPKSVRRSVQIQAVDAGSASRKPLFGMSVEVVGAQGKMAITGNDGRATIENVEFFEDYPLYLDLTERSDQYRHRYPLQIQDLGRDAIPLFVFSPQTVGYWISQMDHAPNENTGLIVGVRTQESDKKEDSLLRLRPLSKRPAVDPELHAILPGEAVVPDGELKQPFSRFIFSQVTEGMYLMEDRNDKTGRNYSETVVVQPGVINVTRPHQ